MIDIMTGAPEKPRFTIVIPAYNEEARIGKMLGPYAEAFADSEIIVVLNGCVDGTRAAVERLRDEYPIIHVVDIPDAVGKGGAVRAGFLLARADAVAYVDADGSTSATEMRRLCEQLGDDDGVIASRWLKGSAVSVRQPILRRIASRTFNGIVRLLFGLPFTDTQCGAKAFRRTAVDAVMPHVETSNFAFDVDVLFHMRRSGCALREVPTTWVDTSGSSVRLVSASSRMLASIVRLRLKHSLLRLLIPIFDRLFPTMPMTLHDRLRILILNWRDPRHPQAGGAEAYLFEQARFWVAWGHHVEWLTASFPGAVRSETLDGIKIRRAGNAITTYFKVPWVYAREFRDRFDVVVDSENGIPYFSPLFSLKPRICVMHHVHQEVFRRHLHPLLAYPLMWCERVFMPYVYRNSTFVAVSNDTREEMLRLKMSRRRVPIVHNGVDASLRPGPKNPVPTLLYLGRLKAYKRVHLALEAFSRVLRQVPNAKFIVAGSGDARDALERLVADLGLGDSVVFEGFVDDSRKRELLQISWALVSASEMEGWGISIIEANACATPAIAYAVPGLREAIVDGVSGILVPPDGDIAEPMIDVLRDTQLREALSRGALSRARDFSWEQSAKHFLNELMQAIAGTEISAVDLDEDWSLIGARRQDRSEKRLFFANRARLRP